MNVWTALLLGLLIGWLLEWLIDWWFWRRRAKKIDVEGLRARLATAEKQTTDLSAQLEVSDSRILALEKREQQAKARIGQLERELQAAQERSAAAEAELQPLAEQTSRLENERHEALDAAIAWENKYHALEQQCQIQEEAAAESERALRAALAEAQKVESDLRGRISLLEGAGVVAAAGAAAFAVGSDGATEESLPADDSWRGEYFRSMDLSGEPVLVRQDEAIDFDWSDTPPAPEVGGSQYSVRWTRNLTLEPGRYNFYITADDGARLWVNDQLILDAWYDHPEETFVAEVEVRQPVVPVRMEYYENHFNAVARLQWEPAAEVAAAPPVAAVRPEPEMERLDLSELHLSDLESVLTDVEVHERRCPQDLTSVDRVDVAEVELLEEAGIGTFWQLVMTPPEVLAEILHHQNDDVELHESIRESALRRAVETNTLGCEWTGTPADDFAALSGLDESLQSRLFAAGICTYQRLAASTVEELADVCGTVSGNESRYASWIEQAHGLLQRQQAGMS